VKVMILVCALSLRSTLTVSISCLRLDYALSVQALSNADVHSKLVALMETTLSYPATDAQWQSASLGNGRWTTEQMQQDTDPLVSSGLTISSAGCVELCTRSDIRNTVERGTTGNGTVISFSTALITWCEYHYHKAAWATLLMTS
jgi:hypothetical protein